MSKVSTVVCGALLAAMLPVQALPAAAVEGPVSARRSEATPLGSVVDGLVAEVLEANLEVAASRANVAQSLAAIDIARARYFPVVDLAGRYTRAEGGREIEIPVGDLLNPVYKTLNEILEAQGKPGSFPKIENTSLTLVREQEQQTGLLLTQPIFDLRIGAARRAAESEHLAALGGLDALRGRLARETKQGYWRFLGIEQAVGILDVTLELARANLGANRSLFRNGKITEDFVFRAEADVFELEQQALAATNAVVLARGWVNLLRNQPFDRELPPLAVRDDDVASVRSVVAAGAGSPMLDVRRLQDQAASRRPELRQLGAAIAAATAGEDAARAANYPTVGLAVDAGTEGESYGVDRDDMYVFASLVVRFNLFRGGADLAGIRQARSRLDELHSARAYAEQKIRLEVLDTVHVYTVAESSLKTAERRAGAAEAAFRIASKKRDLGQINQAEFIDARRALTDAQLNRNRTRFEALAALAAIEYATGVPPAAPVEDMP